MRATHVVRWYGGTTERVAIIVDRTDPHKLAPGRYGEMLIWSEKTGKQRWIDFGLYNAIGIEPLGAAYAAGERLYFSPSLERMPHGTAIPAGMVEVLEVVDHGDGDPTRPRWTYVVKQVCTDSRQGASETELHRWQ